MPNKKVPRMGSRCIWFLHQKARSKKYMYRKSASQALYSGLKMSIL